MTTKTRAVFLDRDGTINEEVGYLSRLEELRLFPETFEALRRFNECGMKVIVVTNQSGVARGFFGEEFVHAVHERINELLRERGAHVDRFYFCPHHPMHGNTIYKKDCHCRKPNPGMILQAARELEIDLSASYMVGDMLKDIQAGHRAGIEKGILVKTGYGENIVYTDMPEYVASDILDAAEWILRDMT